MSEFHENIPTSGLLEIILSNIRTINLIVEKTPFKVLLDEIDATDTLMPILDPTGFRGIMDQLPTIKKVAKKYLEIQDILKEIKKDGP